MKTLKIISTSLLAALIIALIFIVTQRTDASAEPPTQSAVRASEDTETKRVEAQRDDLAVFLPEEPRERPAWAGPLRGAAPVMPEEEYQSAEPPAGKTWTAEEVDMLARAVWGEARGCDTVQQAAVVWCILNRVDSPWFPGSIAGVVTAPDQFIGYAAGNPVDEAILALVEDVLARWGAEKSAAGDVGRVLPAEYLYFSGDGARNAYTTAYCGGSRWDWSAGNPYEEAGT